MNMDLSKIERISTEKFAWGIWVIYIPYSLVEIKCFFRRKNGKPQYSFYVNGLPPFPIIVTREFPAICLTLEQKLVNDSSLQRLLMRDIFERFLEHVD